MPIQNKRGFAVIIEQVFITLFSVLMLLMIILVFSNLKDNVLEFTQRVHFREVGGMLHNAVATAFANLEYSDSGRIELKLPHYIGGDFYIMNLTNDEIFIQDRGNTVNCTEDLLAINATLSGRLSSTGGVKHYVSWSQNSSGKYIKLEALYAT